MRLTIEKLVYGGAGLARTGQGVVFVPRTAPGDVVDVEVVNRKTDYATARVVSLLEPSPDRQTPYCPNYEAAGCCHWQHIRYPRQLEIKESILRETLLRTGRISWAKPIRIVSGPERNYRLRATFQVRSHQLGFVEEGSHAVVPISECAALTTELNAFIPVANGILATPDMATVREVRAASGPPVLAAFGRTRFGEGPARVTVGGLAFDLHPEAFFQSNRYLLEEFMKAVLEWADGARYVLDLFCGSGFFTIQLARRADSILGVERNPVAIRQARLNAKLNHLGNAEFFEGEVGPMLERSKDLRPDLVVLNPPRAGCGREVAAQTAGLGAARIVYVSCNPATFAREVPVFVANGYELQHVTMVDQFPNTYHIEIIGVFGR